MALLTCFTLQDLLKAQAHFKKSNSKRGLMYKGLDGLNIHLIPFFITPGADSGMIWLGHKYPAFTYEAPSSKLD